MSLSPSALAAATSPDRDRFVDLIRLVSIVAVMLGHWMLTLLITHGAGDLAHQLPLQLATWVWQVMPLFFFVGGFSHALSLRHRPSVGVFWRARCVRLLPPVVLLLAVWTVLSAVLSVLGADTGPIDTALDRVTTPLWFLGVYLLLILMAPLLHAAHERFGGWVVLALALGTVLADLAGPTTANANIVLGWGFIHQLGFCYADGRLRGRRWGAGLALFGLGSTVLLTMVWGWYPVLMVGLPDVPDSNMAPPTPALLTHAVALIGVALLLRESLTRWLHRERVWLSTAVGNSVIMTMFCWHLSAAYVVQGVVLLTGLRFPTAGSTAWWACVPLWWAACAVVLFLLVMGFRRFEQSPTTPRQAPAWLAGMGVTITAAGLYLVSQAGLGGLLQLRSSTVLGVPVNAVSALAVVLLGVASLRIGRLAQPSAAS